MSQYIDGNVKTFTAGEALAAFRRVKLSAADTVTYSDAGENWIGVTEQAVSNGSPVPVRLRTASGTVKMTAAGAITVNAIVYAAADGKIDDTATGQPVGQALEAASADGDIIEVAPTCPMNTQNHIADPSGGTTVDAEARSAINSILDALEANGIVAGS